MKAQLLCKLLNVLEITKVTVVMVVMTMMVEGDLEEQTVITTSLGKVRGERLKSDTGKEVDIWASIPFAEPPVASLRYNQSELFFYSKVPQAERQIKRNPPKANS